MGGARSGLDDLHDRVGAHVGPDRGVEGDALEVGVDGDVQRAQEHLVGAQGARTPLPARPVRSHAYGRCPPRPGPGRARCAHAVRPVRTAPGVRRGGGGTGRAAAGTPAAACPHRPRRGPRGSVRRDALRACRRVRPSIPSPAVRRGRPRPRRQAAIGGCGRALLVPRTVRSAPCAERGSPESRAAPTGRRFIGTDERRCRKKGFPEYLDDWSSVRLRAPRGGPASRRTSTCPRPAAVPRSSDAPGRRRAARGSR
ncbi:hypothetical protein SCYAM73S_04138 [Streptomyces cyaneofuscatus]